MKSFLSPIKKTILFGTCLLFLVSVQPGLCRRRTAKTPCRLRGDHCSVFHTLDREGGGNIRTPRLGR